MRGYVLPAVLLFLMLAFGMAALMFRTSATAIRVEQARVLRASRTEWSSPAMASALRLLQTGVPPTDPYTCKLAITDDESTKYFFLTFTQVDATHWSVTSAPGENDLTPEAPTTFTVVPAAPTGFTATPISSSQINLVWTDVAYDEGYLIERSPNGTTGWTQVATTAKNTATYSNTGLAENTTYYYRVCATNSAGNGSYSSTASATTLLDPPTIPAGLTAVVASSSQINLAWSDVATETSYKIERSLDGSTGWSQIATTTANVVSLANTGLSPVTKYYYRVRATNSAGDSGYSDIANATTLIAAPSTPTGLAAVAASSSQINLSWNDVVGETGYLIERSANGTSGWTQIGITSTDMTSFSNTGLPASTRYYYRVRATNASGNSGYTTVVNTTTLVAPPPAPANLVATAASSSQINLSWSNVAGETGYAVERSPDGTTWTQIITRSANVVTYNNTGLVSSTKYYYRVKATNAGGSSGYSNVAEATTLLAPPSTPSGLTATAASSSQINLAWTDVATETAYLIERSPDNSTWAQIGTTTAGVVAYSDTGLSPATRYYYRVRASNAAGNSNYSTSANATTQAVPPAAPTGLTAAIVTTTSIRLDWTDNANNETGFRIERSTDGTTWTLIKSVGVNIVTYTNTSLTKNKLYYYRVRAYNAVGNSAYTDVVTITPQ